MDTRTMTGSMQAGVLIRGEVREYLDSIRIKTNEFTYIESKSLLSSTFHLRGPAYLLKAIVMMLNVRYNEDYED